MIFFSTAGIKQEGIDALNKIIIPIPPLPVQQLIVDTLDKFSSLTESIEEGIPKEIDLLHKQYEYYRNELLTFKKLEPESESDSTNTN